MSRTTEKEDRVKPAETISEFKYEIENAHGENRLLSCFQCGTCTSDCPIARFSDSYSPRKILRMVQLGLKQRVLSLDTLWLCASCFACTDRCPQGVEVATILRVLRNMAAKRNCIPGVFKELGTNILKTGYAYQIPESRVKRREKLGLPPLPQANRERIDRSLRDSRLSHLLKEAS